MGGGYRHAAQVAFPDKACTVVEFGYRPGGFGQARLFEHRLTAQGEGPLVKTLGAVDSGRPIRPMVDVGRHRPHQLRRCSDVMGVRDFQCVSTPFAPSVAGFCAS
ncbi:MAG: hypothetical protein MI923_08280 [Phycisphaerales bacterium]|nr:hypothetical protein [Phycisphaerales bacterium]